MSYATAAWFTIAGATAIVRWALEWSDPAYYDAVSLADYTAVVLQSATMLATGIALLLLRRRPPVPRIGLLLTVAATAAIAHASGNLLEDALNIESAVWAFLLGGVIYMLSLAAAGVAALMVASPLRTSGLFLIAGAVGGMLGHGILLMGVAWIAFAGWIVRHREDQALPPRDALVSSRPPP